MPEWQLFRKHGLMSVVGSRTHMESSYIAEIAQHVAMNNSMDVWVGGSLRNWKWYEIELNRIREQHSQYRIAIITISAPDEMIENNIMKRAAETGREIPQELRQASSVDNTGKGIMRLTHLVDLVASVQNVLTDSGQSTNYGITGPKLKFVSMVDRSGNWDLVRQLTSHK